MLMRYKRRGEMETGERKREKEEEEREKEED